MSVHEGIFSEAKKEGKRMVCDEKWLSIPFLMTLLASRRKTQSEEVRERKVLFDRSICERTNMIAKHTDFPAGGVLRCPKFLSQ